MMSKDCQIRPKPVELLQSIVLKGEGESGARKLRETGLCNDTFVKKWPQDRSSELLLIDSFLKQTRLFVMPLIVTL